ncbi:MAG TPA: thiamine phosphate synthase [Egibacteraceae bacterium]|nr:thiamine phosphate synthase [Egibacteraceae bacterium]
MGAEDAQSRVGTRRRARLADAWLYVCVDRRHERGDLRPFLDAVLGAGADVVQLRDKAASPGQLRAASEVFRDLCDRHGALFIANDDPQLAVEAGADGVHVGQDDVPPHLARGVVGPDLLIGRSTHGVDEIDRALDEDCDYFAVGPVRATPTKQDRPAVGLAPVRHAAAVAGARPWFVTGGMAAESAHEALEAGAERLVVVRAITEAEDPASATAEIAELLKRSR